MGTVYPDLHQTAQHPLHDESLAYEAYPPTADVNVNASNHSSLDFYGTLSQANWTQWLSPQDSVFSAPGSMGFPMVSPHEQQCHSYGFSPDTVTQWDSPSTSMHSNTQPSPSTGSPSLAVSTGDFDSRCGSTSTPSDKQKRKRNATPSTATATATATKSTRRASTKKMTKPEVSSEKQKPKPSRRKTKPVVEPTEEPSPDKEGEEEEEEEEPDHPSRGIQERNRVASNKFRVKKREDAKRLRVDEEGMERTNRELSGTVSDLTLQVYELKMRLLQHTDCECHLIQNYIANEAHRYIEDLGSGRAMQMTPPLPPQHLFRS